MDSNTQLRIRALFAKHCEEVTLEIIAPSTPPECFKLPGRLSISALGALLEEVGVHTNTEILEGILYEYDTSCSGTLDYEEFEEFWGDLAQSLKDKYTAAVSIYREHVRTFTNPDADGDSMKKSSKFLEKYPTQDTYLTSLGLTDPQNIFFGEVVQSLPDLLTDPTFLHRTLKVRINSAVNLDSYTKTEMRKNKGINFSSLSAMLRVQCLSMVRESTILTESTSPTWEYTLSLPLRFIECSRKQLYQFLLSQNVYFSLYDISYSGSTPTTRLIGTANVPLIRVLMRCGRKLDLVLKMGRTDNLFPDLEARVQVSLWDEFSKGGEFLRILDNISIPEELSDKCQKDLIDSLRASQLPEQKVLEHYKIIRKELSAFPERTYPSIVQDEYGKHAFLPSFIFPIRSKFGSIKDILEQVSQIPHRLCTTLPSSNIWWKSLDSQILEDWELKSSLSTYMCLHTSLSPKALFTRKKQRIPSNIITHDFSSRVINFDTCLNTSKPRMSLLERAMLVCNLFLGLGENAYCVSGKINDRPYIWVITISTKQGEEIDAPQNTFIKSHGTDSMFELIKFKNIEKVREISYRNSCYVVKHFDVITGNEYDNVYENSFLGSVECVWNQKNLWFCVLRKNHVTRPTFLWDFNDTSAWIPLVHNVPYFEKFKAVVPYPEVFKFGISYSPSVSEKEFTLKLMKFIKNYRRQELGLEKTFYARELCIKMKQVLETFDTFETFAWKEGNMEDLFQLKKDDKKASNEMWEKNKGSVNVGSGDIFVGVGRGDFWTKDPNKRSGEMKMEGERNQSNELKNKFSLFSDPNINQTSKVETSGDTNQSHELKNKSSLFSDPNINQTPMQIQVPETVKQQVSQISLNSQNPMKSLSQSVVGEIEKAIPRGCVQSHVIFRFLTTDMDAICGNLVQSGVLDTSMQGDAECLYFMAVNFVQKEFGVGVWLGIGSLVDVAHDHDS